MRVFFDISNGARFDFKIPRTNRLFLNTEMPKDTGEIIIDRTCFVIIEDSEYIKIKTSGKPVFGAFITCPFFDGGYYISCDVNAEVGSKGKLDVLNPSQILGIPDYATCSIYHSEGNVWITISDDNWSISDAI